MQPLVFLCPKKDLGLRILENCLLVESVSMISYVILLRGNYVRRELNSRTVSLNKNLRVLGEKV